MTSTEETLTSLRTRITAATSARARAEVEHDNAVRERDAALSALKEFGVSTPEEAAAKLKELEEELAQELAAVETALEESS